MPNRTKKYRNNNREIILLIEDDPNDVLLIKHEFKKAKIQNPITVVDNGDEAIKYLNNIQSDNNNNSKSLPGIILLDLTLPCKSGFEILEWLRKQPVFNHVPIVIITSSQRSIDINRAYNSGANSFLLKPVFHNALLSIMKKFNVNLMKFEDQ
jgi:CheY-like chemotaxis protein